MDKHSTGRHTLVLSMHLTRQWSFNPKSTDYKRHYLHLAHETYRSTTLWYQIFGEINDVLVWDVGLYHKKKQIRGNSS